MAFDRIRGLFAKKNSKEIVTVNLQTVPTWKTERPLTPVQGFERFAEEGFRRNVVVHACVSVVAENVMEPELQIYDPVRDRVIDDPRHPLRVALNNSGGFLEEALIDFGYAGNCFIHKLRAASGGIVGFQRRSPLCIRPILMRNGAVAEFRYSLDGEDPGFPIPAQDLIHFKAVDPLDEFWGLSPLAVLARVGDIDNFSLDYLRTFFLNAGIPYGLLKVKGITQKTEREAVRERWRENYGRSAEGNGDPNGSSYFNVAVIDQDVDYEALGSPVNSLEIGHLFGLTESRTCMIYGIPPIVIGAKVGLDRSTYSNYREAKKSLWEDKLIHTYNRLAATLTRSIQHEFTTPLEIRFDYSMVEALQESMEITMDRATKGYESGLITLDEAREQIQRDPIPNGRGQVFRVPVGVRHVTEEDLIEETEMPDLEDDEEEAQDAIP